MFLYSRCVVAPWRRTVVDLASPMLMHTQVLSSFYAPEQGFREWPRAWSQMWARAALGPVASNTAASKSMHIFILVAVCCWLFCSYWGDWGANTASPHLCQPQCNWQTNRCTCQLGISVISILTSVTSERRPWGLKAVYVPGAVPSQFASFVHYPVRLLIFFFIIKMLGSYKNNRFEPSVHSFPFSPPCSLYCLYLSLVICIKLNCFVFLIIKHSM